MASNLDAAQEQFLKGVQLRECFGNRATVRLDTLGALLDVAHAVDKGRDPTGESLDFLRQEVVE